MTVNSSQQVICMLENWYDFWLHLHPTTSSVMKTLYLWGDQHTKILSFSEIFTM